MFELPRSISVLFAFISWQSSKSGSYQTAPSNLDSNGAKTTSASSSSSGPLNPDSSDSSGSRSRFTPTTCVTSGASSTPAAGNDAPAAPASRVPYNARGCAKAGRSFAVASNTRGETSSDHDHGAFSSRGSQGKLALRDPFQNLDARPKQKMTTKNCQNLQKERSSVQQSGDERRPRMQPSVDKQQCIDKQRLRTQQAQKYAERQSQQAKEQGHAQVKTQLTVTQVKTEQREAKTDGFHAPTFAAQAQNELKMNVRKRRSDHSLATSEGAIVFAP